MRARAERFEAVFDGRIALRFAPPVRRDLMAVMRRLGDPESFCWQEEGPRGGVAATNFVLSAGAVARLRRLVRRRGTMVKLNNIRALRLHLADTWRVEADPRPVGPTAAGQFAAAFRARVLRQDGHEGPYGLEEFCAAHGLTPGQGKPLVLGVLDEISRRRSRW